MARKNIEVDNKHFDISYEILNPREKKNLIILHGWASSKDLMKNVFSPYLKNYKHIYIDLPGFGKSPTKEVLDVYLYTKIIDAFLKSIDASKDIIMGHSYGGKVATLLNPKNLVLLSSAGIIEEKSAQVKLKIKLSKILNTIGLSKITKLFRSKDVDNMSENMYATFKNALKEDLREEFKNFSNKAFIFWGEEDTAASFTAGKQIHVLIKNSEMISYKDDHFFFMKHAKDITQRIEHGIS